MLDRMRDLLLYSIPFGVLKKTKEETFYSGYLIGGILEAPGGKNNLESRNIQVHEYIIHIFGLHGG